MDESDPSVANSVRIVRLVIEELFGPGSSTIDIEFKLDRRVTVLHGRNGSGKTITLRVLDAIRDARFEVLAEYPLKRLRLELSDGSSVEFERQDPTQSGPAPWTLRYKIQRPRIPTPVVGTIESRPEPEPEFEPNGWHVVRIPLERLPQESNGDGRFGTRASLKLREQRLAREAHPDLYALLDRLPEIKFIKADRLFVRAHQVPSHQRANAEMPQLMVERLSQDIRQHIIEADRQYRLTSTRLDSSLPNRLFADHGKLPSLDELETREKDLREQTESLLSLGLLREQPEAIDRSKLTEDQKKTFFIILKDREEKLEPFALVASKAQRLLESLNRKLAPKSVRLDVETGYQVFTANGTPLPLDRLSSGEQHEFVLLHELLFEVRPGSLILIDEPELSLHVTWQKDVLPDLLDIAKLADLDIVLATHSPYIVGDREDLMVRLGEPV